MRRFLCWLAPRLSRRIISSDNATVYLYRHYICGPVRSQNWPVDLRARFSWLPFTVYLHRFIGPDPVRDDHNHPFRAISLILSGAYREKRGTYRRTLAPGSVNWIRPTTFHRITHLLSPEVWTLFITGAYTREWGFRVQDGTFIGRHEYRSKI